MFEINRHGRSYLANASPAADHVAALRIVRSQLAHGVREQSHYGNCVLLEHVLAHCQPDQRNALDRLSTKGLRN